MKWLTHKKRNSIENQKNTIRFMLARYCKIVHQSSSICKECEELTLYALARLTNCRYGDEKPSCKNCSTHCYAPQKRAMMEQRMRKIGPKMVYLRYFIK